jgi:hypothetical protein
MLRSFIAVVVGLVVAVGLITANETLKMQWHPLPAGFDPADPEALQRLMLSTPLPALLQVCAGWAIGALAGGFVAGWIGQDRGRGAALAVGTLLLAATGLNFLLVPYHPVWMVVLGLALPLPLAWAGQRLVR